MTNQEGLRKTSDPLRSGQEASYVNVGHKPPAVGGAPFNKEEDDYQPQSVPDGMSAEGNIPPEIVSQASREREGYYPENI